MYVCTIIELEFSCSGVKIDAVYDSILLQYYFEPALSCTGSWESWILSQLSMGRRRGYTLDRLTVFNEANRVCVNVGMCYVGGSQSTWRTHTFCTPNKQ